MGAAPGFPCACLLGGPTPPSFTGWLFWLLEVLLIRLFLTSLQCVHSSSQEMVTGSHFFFCLRSQAIGPWQAQRCHSRGSNGDTGPFTQTDPCASPVPEPGSPIVTKCFVSRACKWRMGYQLQPTPTGSTVSTQRSKSPRFYSLYLLQSHRDTDRHCVHRNYHCGRNRAH
jgi:hypothetical protein